MAWNDHFLPRHTTSLSEVKEDSECPSEHFDAHDSFAAADFHKFAGSAAGQAFNLSFAFGASESPLYRFACPISLLSSHF